MVIVGCAEIKTPKPGEFFKDPLGEGALNIGMTKSQVLVIYGEPNIEGTVSSGEWSQTRNEWLYRATYSGLPTGIGYLSEDLYLYFDGESLTNISRKPLGEETP
jgi:hypothetical protein